MIKTINEEIFYQGSEQKTGTIYSEVKSIAFQVVDNVAVIYNELGFIETIEDVELGNYEKKNVLSTKVLKYTDEELKSLIEGVGRDFNSPVTNLVIQEMNTFSDDIILKDITDNPTQYFGLTSDKWTK